MIEMANINKTYRVSRRGAGFKSAMRNLVKREHEIIQALDNINLKIEEGEMVGYIGPNGAGKSTTIKIMCGILTPDSGSCVINGFTPWKERHKYVGTIGVVFGQRSQLWWDVPVIDSFEMIREIYKVDSRTYKRNLDELTTTLELEKILQTPARSLSLGQKMRCEIVASLLHSPRILFLDEPTIGLDATSKIAVRNFIKELNAKNGTTVILTTHDMQDVEELAERIILIGKGKILLDGEFQAVRKKFSDHRKIVVDYIGGNLTERDGVEFLEKEKGHALLNIDTRKRPVSEVIAYLSSQVEIKDISVMGVSTEEMVVNMYKEYQI